MKPTAQSRRAPRGDCIRACLASLFELPLERVPDFTNMREDPDSAYPVEYLERQAWCKDQGYAFVEVELKHLRWSALPFSPFVIFLGIHTSGERHAIVGRCEDNLFIPVYDPLEPEGLDVIPFQDGKILSIAFLVPLDPSKMKYSKPYEPAIIRLDGNN